MTTNKQIIKEFENKFGLSGLYSKPAEYMNYESQYDKVKQFLLDKLEQKDKKWRDKINELESYVDRMWVDEHDDIKADKLLREIIEQIKLTNPLKEEKE